MSTDRCWPKTEMQKLGVCDWKLWGPFDTDEASKHMAGFEILQKYQSKINWKLKKRKQVVLLHRQFVKPDS